MTVLAITGWSALCSAGVGVEAMMSAVTGAVQTGPRDASGLYEEPLPEPQAHVLADFSVREHLGRKGTSLFDRWTAFSVVTSGLALADGGIELDQVPRDRVGLVLGTTAGGLKSTSDFSRDTLVQDKPYLVTPSLFPNTVMNCGTGQSAIWHGLRAVNATVAGGPLAMLQALRYARTSLGRRYADTLLTGAVEEFSPHTAWTRQLATVGGPAPSTTPPGEGAAVFVLRRAEDARAEHAPVDAEILAVTTGYCPGPHDDAALRDALTGSIRQALRTAGVAAEDVRFAATGDEGLQHAAVTAAIPTPVHHIPVARLFGDCQAASGALQLAAVLALHRSSAEHDGAVSVLTGHTPDGGVGAAVVKGWSRGSHHG